MKKTYSLDINNIIALCHLINKNEEVNSFSEELIEIGYKLDYVKFSKFINKIERVSNGQHVLLSGFEKKFYLKYKDVIDIIITYSNMTSFSDNNNYRDIIELYNNYLLFHKEEIANILAVLYKLLDLGFEEIYFNEDYDFTNMVFEFNLESGDYTNVSYLDNLQVIPSYPGVIKYKSDNSNYKIDLEYTYLKTLIESKIGLNSLLFDPSRLPNSLNMEFVFDEINDKARQYYDINKKIKNSVNLSVGINDLLMQAEITGSMLDGLENVESRKELIEILNNILVEIKKLEKLSCEYNVSLSNKEPKLSKEFLEEEKKKYLSKITKKS